MAKRNKIESEILKSIPLPRGDNDTSSIIETLPLPLDGYCLITAGAVGAGKSTFQNSLMHRLYKDARIVLKILNEDGEIFQSPELQDWILRFDRGDFPSSTSRNLMQTFNIEFGADKRFLAKLSFLEISGEHFQDILPTKADPDYQPQLNTALENILTTPSVKKLFVFIADSTRYDDSKFPSHDSEDERDQPLYQDMLFSCLLNEIRRLGLKKIRLLFIASKWDVVSFTNTSTKKFFREHFPRTRATLRNFSNTNENYLQFSVGKVQDVKNEHNKKDIRKKIIKHDYSQIDRVIHWIYYQAKDRKLKGYPPIRLTLWEKIKNWAAS